MATEKPTPPPEGFLFPRLAVVMRERLNIKPSELARRLGVTPAAVSQYEDPSKPITEATLRRYAEALGQPFETAMFDALVTLRLQRAADVPPPAEAAP